MYLHRSSRRVVYLMRPTQTANDTVERAVPRNEETGNKQYDTVGTIQVMGVNVTFNNISAILW
jgi:hypothetical protein